ncbi:MAG: ABC transporter permease [Wujia sp.]
MNTFSLFGHLIVADIKRIKKYIASIFISMFILLGICLLAGLAITKYVYKEDSLKKISIAFYVPDDGDKKYNMLGIGMLSDMNSMENAAILTQVDSIDEGYRMIDNNAATYFIIVPENFFSGIMDSTNPPIEIVMRDNTNAMSYISNELFLSYASYLAIAQSGIYSALDTVRKYGLDYETEKIIQDKVNLIFLDRALNKDGYCEIKNATDEGSYTLVQHYIASALFFSLCLVAFVMSPMLMGRNHGMTNQLEIMGIRKSHIFISNYISSFISIYMVFVPCLIGICIVTKSFHFTGLLSGIPAILGIALIIALITTLSGNVFTANIVILVATIVFAYIGGGILPHAMTPEIIKNISEFLPGQYIIKGLSFALFG